MSTSDAMMTATATISHSAALSRAATSRKGRMTAVADPPEEGLAQGPGRSVLPDRSMPSPRLSRRIVQRLVRP